MSGHRFGCRVYFEDTDAGGVVYHASYLRFAERARTEALRELGIPHAVLFDEFGLIFVVRRIKMDYWRPARLDDWLEVVTRVLSLGASRVELEQIVQRGGEMLVEAAVTLACMRQRDGRPVRIPPRWRDALARLAEGKSGDRKVREAADRPPSE